MEEKACELHIGDEVFCKWHFWQNQWLLKPIRIFKIIFHKTFFELVLEQSDKYAAHNNNKLNLTEFEL